MVAPDKVPPTTYKNSGVDIDAASRLTRKIGSMVRETFTSGVLTDIGGFGAMFRLGAEYREPVLISSIDSVGTKLLVAVAAGRHSTVGIDLVSHCVNDILAQGAQPLFFLDYFASGKLDVEVAEQVIAGLVEGCKGAGCALIGGEIAELPGIYPDGIYDLAGAITGVVERNGIVDGSSVKHGDAIIGLASSGLHTNGYSLVRKLLLEGDRFKLDDHVEELGKPLVDELLEPHRCYAPALLPVIERYSVHGIAHITGGGMTDNIPRSIPEGLGVRIEKASLEVRPIFALLQQLGNVPEEEMFRTFNMGIGMVLMVSPEDAPKVLADLRSSGETAQVVGEVVKGSEGVSYC